MIQNDFSTHSKAVPVTVVSIVIIAVLVVCEKTYAPVLRNQGDMYRALSTFTVMTAKIVVPLILLKWICGLNLRSLGWTKGRAFTAVWKGIVLAGCMLVFMVLYQKLSPLLFTSGYKATGKAMLTPETPSVVAFFLMTAALLNAFGEEIIFRGMLMSVLSRKMGIALVLVVQSLIFTVYHLFPLQNSILLFCMGILFGLGYVWSGLLLTPVLAHLIENGTGIVIVMLQ